MNRIAYLSQNQKEGVACFEAGRYRIYFATSEKLEKFIKVLHWNDGYLIVMAKYEDHPEEEGYIDLRPVLDYLKIDKNEFLESIKAVEICDEVKSKPDKVSEDEKDSDFVFSELEDDAIEEEWIFITDLNHPEETCVLDREGRLIESCMSEQRLRIAQEIIRSQKVFPKNGEPLGEN